MHSRIKGAASVYARRDIIYHTVQTCLKAIANDDRNMSEIAQQTQNLSIKLRLRKPPNANDSLIIATFHWAESKVANPYSACNRAVVADCTNYRKY